MKYYLIIIILFLKTSLSKNTKKTKNQIKCSPQNIHITLGDFFQDESSEIIYRIGFMQENQKCKKKINLLLEFENGEEQFFDITTKRAYSLKGEFFKKQLDYSRNFFFIELKNLINKSKFSYTFLENGEKIKGPFYFSTNILNDKKSVNIKTFGDHDLKKGKEIIKRLEIEDYDLLILLGDYSYNMQDENGKRGDDYFNGLENLITKAPVIIIPGNHETIDNTRLLNSRLFLPGTKNALDNNFTYFKVQNLFFFLFNSDFYSLNYRKKNKMDEKINSILKISDDLQKEADFEYFKIVLTHRPFYCQEHFNRECLLNSLFLKEIDEKLNKHNFDLVLSGHLHFYQRLKHQRNYKIDSNSYLQLIIGTGGNDHFFGKSEFQISPFIEKNIFLIEGYLELQTHYSFIEAAFVEANNGVALDQFLIHKKNFRIFHDFTGFFFFWS